MLIKDNDVVLFQGDSVTDCGRDRNDGDAMGTGYAMMAAAWFQARHPQMRVRFVNRGISGNRVRDLERRWREDCLDLRPSIVSILIGVNDCWRRYDSNDPTPVADFSAGYRNLLTHIRDSLDNPRIVLCEPFVLPVSEERQSWREDIDPKIQTVRSLAREFNASYVPYDGMFAQACAQREPGFWAADGVHPSDAGHALMAQAWLGAMQAL